MPSHPVLLRRLQKRMDELNALDPAREFGMRARTKAEKVLANPAKAIDPATILAIINAILEIIKAIRELLKK